MATVKPIPEGYTRVIPYLSVEGAEAAIEFYTEVFDAKEPGAHARARWQDRPRRDLDRRRGRGIGLVASA